MPFEHRQFDVPLTRDIDRDTLQWPEPGEAGEDGEDSGFGGNRHYSDMRGADWGTVGEFIDEEEEFVRRIENAADVVAEAELIAEERDKALDEGEIDQLWGIDIGVAAATVALSAARCIPFSSCNAGALDGEHHAASNPYVALMLRKEVADVVVAAARDAGVGLVQHQGGEVVVCAPNIPSMMAFARALYERSAEIDAILIEAGDENTR